MGSEFAYEEEDRSHCHLYNGIIVSLHQYRLLFSLLYNTDIEPHYSAVVASGISLYYRYQLTYGNGDINWNEGAFVSSA